MRNRLGVFGGSFNPPHRAHEQIARELLERGLVDELWIVPVFTHPFGKRLAPFEDRLEMCRRAFAGLGDRLQLSDLERRLGGASYTVRTLEAIRRERPDSELYLVVGADAVRDWRHWHEFARIRELASLLVIPRQGEPQGEVQALDVPAPANISSTEIRAHAAAGRDLSAWLSPGVEAYVIEHALYRNDAPSEIRGES